jgi:hypothetical protein
MSYISRLREQTVESDYAVALYMSDGRSCSPPTFARRRRSLAPTP